MQIEDLKSSRMVHKYGDIFNPPALTNFLGCVQANVDLTGIRNLSFPPFACGDTITAGLYVDDKYFPATGCPIAFTWYPDRIIREAEYEGLKFKTTTILAVKKMAAIVKVQIENQCGIEKKFKIRLGCRGNVTKCIKAWSDALPPSESDNRIEIDSKRKAILFSARHSSAHFLQGTFPVFEEINPFGMKCSIELSAGEKEEFYFIIAVGESPCNTQNLYDSIVENTEVEFQRARDDWDEEIKAIFTPGNSRYSGSLPTFETIDQDILKLYYTGILGVIYFKRDNPYSVYGRAYDTLMPRYWQTTTFILDYSFSSLVHALLDPEVMQKCLEKWMLMDVHKHFGSEYLTGNPVGIWYSGNDYGLTLSARNYLLWSGNLEWLQKKLADLRGKSKPQRVINYLEQYANSWKIFKTNNGLADYGGINNLLECVSTYIHEVASLNAANVFSMRFVAEALSIIGESGKSKRILSEAEDLLRNVQKLYVDSKGYWNTRFPDGKLVEVRHCFDLNTLLNTIPKDLTNKQIDEMVNFLKKELLTPVWMRGLSFGDNDVIFSDRPDHQWNGGYTAWPAQAVTGLYRVGQTDLAFEWLKGLAKSANQGPFGQAHFVENIVSSEDGGAKKAPSDLPYISDWACAAGGNWVNIIIESIFGVKPTLTSGICAYPKFGAFDPNAELRNLPYQGKLYRVTRHGISEEK